MTVPVTDLEDVQIEVQRKLGRCMLLLQQYERLMKAVLSSMAISGSLDQLPSSRDQRMAKIRTKTLGTLVKQFTGEHLTVMQGTELYKGEDSSSLPYTSGPRIDVRYSLGLSTKVYEETKAGLAELVDLRNELVHHLVEQFDLTTISGCCAASLHLDRCYERIEKNCQLLKTWATSIDEVQTKARSFFQSVEFENAFLHGVHPDGTVSWERSSVVEDLRSVESSCKVDGWTPLDAAIRLINSKDKSQVPTRYGCKTWRQLLQRSGQFESKTIAEPNGSGRRVWYRSCA